MQYQKITKLLGTTSDNVPKFINKNEQQFIISQVLLKIDINHVNK